MDAVMEHEVVGTPRQSALLIGIRPRIRERAAAGSERCGSESPRGLRGQRKVGSLQLLYADLREGEY